MAEVMVRMAAFAPTPSAMVRTRMTVVMIDRRRDLWANWTSWRSMCLTENITTAIFNQAIVTWLLLLHQVPPSPPYLRAKVLRRLKQVGALPLKKSAYLLPNTEDALEDFQWILNEIRSDGGEAWILRADAVAGLTDESIRESFRELRAAEYQELLAEVSGNL